MNGPPIPWDLAAAAANVLSTRETQVISLLADGATWKSAAGVLGISIRTVEANVLKIRAKLRVANTTQAVRLLLTRSGKPC